MRLLRGGDAAGSWQPCPATHDTGRKGQHFNAIEGGDWLGYLSRHVLFRGLLQCLLLCRFVLHVGLVVCVLHTWTLVARCDSTAARVAAKSSWKTASSEKKSAQKRYSLVAVSISSLFTLRKITCAAQQIIGSCCRSTHQKRQ